MSKFKVGDRVRIAEQCDQFLYSVPIWNESYMSLIQGTVNRVTGAYRLGGRPFVKVQEGYWFHEDDLTLIEDEEAPKSVKKAPANKRKSTDDGFDDEEAANTFSLDEFKSVGYAVTRDGKVVRFVAHVPGARLERERVIGLGEDGAVLLYTEDGCHLNSKHSSDNLVSIKHPTVTFNAIEVPAPEKTAPANGVTYWTPTILEEGGSITEVVWDGGWYDRARLRAGLVWLTKVDALAALDAMLKPLREYVADTAKEG